MNNTICLIEEALEIINISEGQFYSKINEIIPCISEEYKSFIMMVPKLNSVGMDISIDGLTNQLSALMDAIEHRDLIDIYDCMKMEIEKTLECYYEILLIMEGEK